MRSTGITKTITTTTTQSNRNAKKLRGRASGGGADSADLKGSMKNKKGKESVGLGSDLEAKVLFQIHILNVQFSLSYFSYVSAANSKDDSIRLFGTGFNF